MTGLIDHSGEEKRRRGEREGERETTEIFRSFFFALLLCTQLADAGRRRGRIKDMRERETAKALTNCCSGKREEGKHTRASIEGGPKRSRLDPDFSLQLSA